MLAALIYLLLTIANSLIIEWLETRANRGVRRV
jgi:ABC-type arginine transport system permease subunit